MEYLVGAALALVVCLSAGAAGFDRDRSFYPVILIVIASYYLLFAVLGIWSAIAYLGMAPAPRAIDVLTAFWAAPLLATRWP